MALMDVDVACRNQGGDPIEMLTTANPTSSADLVTSGKWEAKFDTPGIFFNFETGKNGDFLSFT